MRISTKTGNSLELSCYSESVLMLSICCNLENSRLCKVFLYCFDIYLLVIFNGSVAESQEQWFEPLLYGGMAESLKQSQNLSISSIRIEHD